MSTIAVEAASIAMSYGPTQVLTDVNLAVEREQVHALIGPNGAGKSTLFKILSGEMRPTSGTVFFDGEDHTGIAPAMLTRRGVARSFQVPRVFDGLTVAENLTISLEAADRWHRRDKKDSWWVQGVRPWVRDAAAEQLESLGIVSLIDVPVAELAHGDRKLVELALILAQDPAVLLLDEPMAGMSPDEVRRCADVLEGLHQQKSLTILLVEHDMETVFRIASSVSVLAGGVVIASGAPQSVRSDDRVKEAYLGRKGEG